MSPAKSTTSLPTCVSKSSELSGCPSPTRPANLHTATSARYFVRQRTTCKTTASLERGERGDSRPRLSGGQSPAALLSARTEKRTPGELRPPGRPRAAVPTPPLAEPDRLSSFPPPSTVSRRPFSDRPVRAAQATLAPDAIPEPLALRADAESADSCLRRE